MSIKFVHQPPGKTVRTDLDDSFLDELVDALLDHPNQWARVPIEKLYPNAKDLKQNSRTNRARNFTTRVNRGDISLLAEYPVEATTRGTDVYIRIPMTKRQLNDLY